MSNEMRSFARIGYFHSDTLLEMAIDSFILYQNLLEKCNKLKKIEDDLITFEKEEEIKILENSLLKESIKIVIFLSSFLESYFFDFSAIVLGQKYTENHIEKLDLASKIMLIPRLVTGKQIDKSKHYWSEIKELIKWRNKIIHNKTKNSIEFFKNIKPSEYDPKNLYEEFEVVTFFEAIKELFNELDKMDQKGFHYPRININMKRLEK